MDTKKIEHIADYLRNPGNAYCQQTEDDLRRLWEESNGTPPPSEKLMRAVHRSLRMEKFRRVAKICAAAAVLAGVFITGYMLAPNRNIPATHVPQKYMLITAEGSVGNYRLPDGTQVWLNGASRLEYYSDFATNRKARLHGEGYFDVERDTVHPFRLSMEHIQVEVLGTAFDARSYGNGAKEDVVLRRGSVKVETAGDTASAILRPDQRLVFEPGTRTSAIQTVEAVNYCRWMEERLTFSNVPLADIITNLERKYNVEIELAPNLNLHKRLSLTVEHDPLVEVMATVNALTGTRSTYLSNDRIILYDKNSSKPSVK